MKIFKVKFFSYLKNSNEGLTNFGQTTKLEFGKIIRLGVKCGERSFSLKN